MNADLRINPLTGRRVVVTPGRATRPGATGHTSRRDDGADCPFCEGHEHLTPPELEADRPQGPPDSPGWTVRIVPNRYPALPGHEVTVHGPAHVTATADTAAGVLERAVAAWQRRRTVHHAAGAALVLAGINEGAAAGASLPHSHSQIVPFAELPGDALAQRAAF